MPNTSSLEVRFRLEPLTKNEKALHERALQKAAAYTRSEVELLEIIQAIDQSRLYLKWDLGSTFAYCVSILKLSPAVTSNFINVARKSREVRKLKDAIKMGELSVATARKIVPVLTPANQEHWLQRAKNLSQAQLEREVAETSPQAWAQEQDRVRRKKNNQTRLEITLPKETWESFEKARDLISESLGRTASLEEVLRELLKVYLRQADPVAKAQRAVRKKEKAASKSVAATNVSQTQKMLSQSRKRKPLPAEMVHAVYLRDQGRCQAVKANGSVCGRKRFLHLHHKIPLARGGGHSVDNVITLCSQCHLRWHRTPNGRASREDFH